MSAQSFGSLGGSRSRRGALVALLAAALLGGGLGACDSAPDGEPLAGSDAGPSPNASILPTPLAEAPDLDAGASGDGGSPGETDASGRLAGLGTSAPPSRPFEPGQALPADALSGRDLSGVTLEAAWRWRDVPAAPKAPEVGADAIREAAKRTGLSWRVHLAEVGRMRVEVTARALPLPKGAELRARADRWGAVVLWPNATEYRIVPPGALRTLLGERRVDVMPLVVGTVRAEEGRARKLGVLVRKVEIPASLATLRLELGKVPEAGEGGPLLCRALLEIAGIDPKSPICQAGEVPLGASYAWTAGGGLGLEVTAIEKRTDLTPSDMVVPPAGAALARSGLPSAGDGVFLTRDELAGFRSAPLPLPPPSDPNAPGEGIVAMNRGDALMYLLVDGVPVAAVPARESRYVIGPPRGRYVVQWRSFLGDRVEPPETVELPARLVYGTLPDAGAPDGG